MKFEIYDGRNPRILDNHETIIEAKTARQALQQYLNSQELGHIKFYNTSDNDVVWRTSPFIERDGQKYHAGRISWWGVKPTKIS